MVQENANKYANKIGHSDVYPFEVVNTVSEKTLEVRAMEAINVKPATMIAKGGFVGHFDNSTQKWSMVSNHDNPIVKIRRNKKGEWKDRDGGTYLIADEPRKVHDYNF